MSNVSPPKWAQQFVEWYCKPKLAEDLLGDLNEYFERNLEKLGPRRARFIYVIDALKFFRPYTVRTPKFINVFISWLMIGSYIKTSTRNVMRNKLFSSINIIGLAISMSVGLLLIGFLHDLMSYEKFHEKGDRIYRVTNLPTWNKTDKGNKFGSTSIKTGKLIKEKVTGIEDVATISNGFGGDAHFDDKIIPLGGFWADNSFLNILTFPMIKGNIHTALKEPYSLVLTESTAKKFFGDDEALGKTLHIDTLDYHVTGVLKDIPFFSYLKFESLASFSTIDNLKKNDKEFNDWNNMWSNYVYVLMPENGNVPHVQSQLDALAAVENNSSKNSIELGMQNIYHIVLGEDVANNAGPNIQPVVVWIIAGLAFVVILSACFNYTNLSIARSMRRFKEIGLRKVIGAGKGQVRQQFLAEAVIVSLASLILSFGLFLIIRPLFVNMAPELQNLVKLDLTPLMVTAFVVFSIAVGIMAGFFPAVFFSKVGIINALRNSASIKVFKHLSLRRVLVVVQYTFTLTFITATAIGYSQYKSILAFDLGFNTANVLNVDLKGNVPETVMKEFREIPEVTGISRSMMITSVGNYWGGTMKYNNSQDSTQVWYNRVDENYLPLHAHKLVAGGNFIARPTKENETSEIIVNEQTLKRFDIGKGNPEKAIGEEVVIDKQKLKIVGVLKDFHYGKVDSKLEPVVFMMWTDEQKYGYLNLKIESNDIIATRAKIEAVWASVDKVHPIEAKFYNDEIEKAYSEFSVMIKMIGFLSFLAISIASMGLFGMVVFTTETRLKEIGIRKVMGASSGNLVYLLSRGFMILLSVSALIAIPATYFFFEGVILTNFPYHSPIQITELFSGLIVVLIIAFIMIGSQTMKAARSNPAEVLKSE